VGISSLNAVVIRQRLFVSEVSNTDVLIRKIWGLYYVERYANFKMSTFGEIQSCVYQLLSERMFDRNCNVNNA
jgi:hypothetical protein